MISYVDNCSFRPEMIVISLPPPKNPTAISEVLISNPKPRTMPGPPNYPRFYRILLHIPIMKIV